MKLNQWSEIRRLAREMRKKVLQASGGDSSPDALLSAIAEETKIKRVGLTTGDPLLYKAQAILHSNFVFYDKSFEKWQVYFNQMHEYAHYFLNHGSTTLCRHEDFDPEASEDAIAFGEQRIEGYGPHERRELEANLYAREFFLPCDELRENFLAGENDESIAEKFEMPSGMVIHQLMRAVLGIETETPDAGENETESDGIILDDDQLVAAHFGTKEFKSNEFEPPVLVDAGPGTGKTRTLTARIVHLINDREILPDNILSLTYSNKAAEEMYSRVSAATAQNASRIWMGTFHRFCLELIRKYHYILGISAKPLVADAYDVQILLDQSLNRLNLRHYRSLTRPSANFQRILNKISRAKDELASPEDFERAAQIDLENAANNKRKLDRAEKDLEIAYAYRIYQEVLAENNFLDYGDLLFKAVNLLRENETVLEEVQSRYRYILIDEYQDVNTASRELLKLVAGKGSGLWVVGDIRQAIYRFRGAAPTNMLLLTEEDYTAAEVKQLTVNYRAKNKIVDTFTACSNGMKAQVETSRITEWKVNRKENDGEVNFIEAADEFDEAEAIVDEIKRLHAEKINYRNQAILCRRHDDLVHYSMALEDAGIPVLYLGNFFERPEIRDLLCVIDLASGMEGRSLYRLAGFDEYGFSFDDVGELIKYTQENKLKFPRALSSVEEINTFSEQGNVGLSSVKEHFADWHKNSSAWTVLSQYLFDKSNYLRRLVKDTTPQTMQRRLAIYQLLLLTYQLRDKFAELDGDSKKHFLGYIRNLKINKEEKIIRQTPHWADAIDAVKMLTIHAAKGLEFKAIHLPALSVGKFSKRNWSSGVKLPSGILRPEMTDWGAEEEECLFFVALSRACDVLNLYRAKKYEDEPADSSNLLDLISDILPPVQTAPERPKKVDTVKTDLSNRFLMLDFDEKVLQDYINCPLKYQYRHEIKIPYFFSESPISKARLCVSKVWDKISQQNRKKLLVDEQFVNETFEEIWDKHGPAEHPYAADYRQEALAMINWTLITHPPNINAFTKPDWTIKIGKITVTFFPDYIKVVKDGKREILIVEKLNFGESPKEQIREFIYVLYDVGASQNKSDSNVKTEIKASFMTNQATLPVPVPITMIKSGLQSYQDAVNGINNGEFFPQVSKDCPFCPYYFICSARQT